MGRVTNRVATLLAVLLVVGASCSKDRGGGSGEKRQPWTPIDPGGMSRKHVALVLGKKVTLAAVGHARGLSRTSVDHLLADARTLAATLGATVPDLPALTGEKDQDLAWALNFALRKAGLGIMAKLRDQGSSADAAAYELAVQVLLVLPLYAPGKDPGRSMSRAIARALDAAVLPQDATLRTLVRKIDAKAPEAEVRAAAEKGLAEAEAGLASARGASGR
jgi:hypothetical protein